MKNSTSWDELEALKGLLRSKKLANLRIADFCLYALLKNKNYGMNCTQLMDALLALGYKTEGSTLDRTISTVVRYQNCGLFTKSRNGKFKLRRSVVEKATKRSMRRRINPLFNSSPAIICKK